MELQSLDYQTFVPRGRLEMVALLLASARIMGLFLVLPSFPKTIVPGIVRTGVIVGLAILHQRIIVLDPALPGLSMPMLAALVAKEALLGGAMGMVAGVLFWGMEAAGFFFDNHRGAAIASSVNPLTGSESAPMGIFFGQLFTAYFFISGSFLVLLGLFYDTYAVFPVLEFLPRLPSDTVPFFLGVADKVMFLSVLLAGPMIIVMFLTEFGLALVSRFAPQLNVFVLAMPVKSAAGMFLLVLFVPFLFYYLDQQLMSLRTAMDAFETLWRAPPATTP